MGEVLYDDPAGRAAAGVAVRVYAPVGGHRDLLAYLVRRLLENGANSSFVSVAADPSVPVAAILRRPQSWIGDPRTRATRGLPLPRDLYRARPRNSAGVEFGDRAGFEAFVADVRRGRRARLGGTARRRRGRGGSDARSASRHRWRDGRRGCARPMPPIARAAMTAAAAGFAGLAGDADRDARRPARARRRSAGGAARAPHRADADGGRQDLDDALAEVREAVDFCRYYAAMARRELAPQATAGTDRRDQRIAPSRTRRVRLHQPVEFSARDLPRTGRGRAGRRQFGGGEARRADPA